MQGQRTPMAERDSGQVADSEWLVSASRKPRREHRSSNTSTPDTRPGSMADGEWQMSTSRATPISQGSKGSTPSNENHTSADMKNGKLSERSTSCPSTSQQVIKVSGDEGKESDGHASSRGGGADWSERGSTRTRRRSYEGVLGRAFWRHSLMRSFRRDDLMMMKYSEDGLGLSASPPPNPSSGYRGHDDVSADLLEKGEGGRGGDEGGEDEGSSYPWWQRPGFVMRSHAIRVFILWLWLLGGVAIATLGIVLLVHSHSAGQRRDLQSCCEAFASALEANLTQNAQEVDAFRGLLQTLAVNSTLPLPSSEAQFQTYFSATQHLRPFIPSVLYAHHVAQSERNIFEQKQGHGILDVYGWSTRGTAAEYGPIVYSGANDLVASTGGYLDVLEVPEIKAAADQACSSGKAALSSPTKLPENAAFFPTLVLIFSTSSGATSATTLQNSCRKGAIGWLVAPIDVPSLLTSLFTHPSNFPIPWNGMKCSLQVWLYDITDSSSITTLYTANSMGAVINLGAVLVEESGLMGKVGVNLSLPDSDRTIWVRCDGTAGSSTEWRPVVWGFCALVVTFLMACLLASLGSRITDSEAEYLDMRDKNASSVEARKIAERADNSKSQFLATVSHEIRTPLNGVLGMLSLLRDTRLDATQIDYVQTAVSSGKALIGLINDVLDFSKIEAGKMEIDSIPFDVRSELDDVLSLFAEKVRSKGVELAGLVQLAVPNIVVGDSGRFRQVIINLVGNATKFTEHGHILVTIRLLEDDEDLKEIHSKPPVPVDEYVPGEEMDDRSAVSENGDDDVAYSNRLPSAATSAHAAGHPAADESKPRSRMGLNLSEIIRLPAVARARSDLSSTGETTGQDGGMMPALLTKSRSKRNGIIAREPRKGLNDGGESGRGGLTAGEEEVTGGRMREESFRRGHRNGDGERSERRRGDRWQNERGEFS
eukprot:TRINITY_DN1615_c0_g2_i1.p1 TRINITY_DN1615_c0_g2~~TRINITY_DN1615_c0_g2_i1.p1  ORF type:complete len:937 (-),score=128.73 TRINITY_DN1615_c0_g2_i1:5158-7968(-)